MTHNVYIGLGSNLGDCQANLKQAQKYIAMLGRIIKCSSPYANQPWRMTSSQPFLNQVLQLQTSHAPQTLLKCLLSIEQQLGRVRSTQSCYCDRYIDLDILYYDNLHIALPKLFLPHPGIAERHFVLVPMVEIAPDWIHPTLGKTQRQLLLDLRGRSKQVDQLG